MDFPFELWNPIFRISGIEIARYKDIGTIKNAQIFHASQGFVCFSKTNTRYSGKG